jgi:hypothetical protein
MSYPSIADHRVIGDLQTAALVPRSTQLKLRSQLTAG